MCEREREFCHFLIFFLDGNGTDARMATSFLRKQLNAATFSTSRVRHTESCGKENCIVDDWNERGDSICLFHRLQ